MKRWLGCVLSVLLVLSGLPGCGSQPDTPASSAGGTEGKASSSTRSSSASTTSGSSAGSASGTHGSTGSSTGGGASGSTGGGSSTTGAPTQSTKTTTATTTTAPKKDGFTAVTYPAEIVKTLGQRGVSPAQFAALAAAGHNYVGNGGREGGSLVVSPYYTLQVNGQTVPVYATPVYVGSKGGYGAIHSFAVLEITGTPTLTVEATKTDGTPRNAVVLPASRRLTPTLSGSTAKMTLTKEGSYTLLVDNASQDTALTVFVRRARDEEAEIAAYKQRYGEKRVLVFEPGVHYVDYIDIPMGSYVVYLRTGALLLAKHKFDIPDDASEKAAYEEETVGKQGIGLTRFPFINCHNKTNVTITGGGTIDFSALDWHERRGIFVTQTTGLTVEGITLINAPEWTLTTYRCTGITVRDLIIFGYKTNSDGVAICNSKQATVTNCFARSGDDLFEVKGLGGVSTAVVDDVTFTDCVAWGGKARCFGVIGEVNLPVSNVTFRDCAILYRDATWDNDRLGGLVVIVEEKGAPVSHITFDNIEIFRDEGRAINCTYYNPDLSGCSVTDVVFRNITYSTPMKILFKARGKNTLRVTLENVRANGTVITAGNLAEYATQDEGVTLTVE